MIFNFRVLSDEVDDFRRQIEIDADATFMDLKNAICDSVGYNKNQMCSFFICSDGWEKEKEITLEDMDFDADQDVYLMEDTILSDMIEDEGQKLMFTFDYMTDRSFFIEMSEIITGRTLPDALCTASRGNAPAQTMELEDFDVKPAKGAASTLGLDIDDDFYGSDEYSDDDLDAAGLSEMTPDDM